MPVALPIPVRRLSQREFGELAFEVMRQVFAIHYNIGRFFDEKIYKRELAHRLPDVRLIAPGVAFKITGFTGPLAPFEEQARRLLAHVNLRAIAWVNINMKEVTFTTLER